ncbi:MAG: hypothetical protein M1822_010181 [Bathelium mastoideum]|nr:MAG: hypothetical protein M1822_010181 [Bathelium mastoideum]
MYGPRGKLAAPSSPLVPANVPWYRAEISPKRFENSKETKEFFISVTGTDSQSILVQRIQEIRDRAWAIAPYPCFGQFRFLEDVLSASPFYNEIVYKVKAGASVLDLGSGLGQDLRRLLVAAGRTWKISDTNGNQHIKTYAADVTSEFWDLGLELFGDEDHPPAKFLEVDAPRVPNMGDNPLKAVKGQIDIYMLCQVLDLFDWERQSYLLQNVFRTSVVGSVVVGHIPGTLLADTGEDALDGHVLRMLHSSETLHNLWRDASEVAPSTAWKLTVNTTDISSLGYEQAELDWMHKPPRVGLFFHAVRVE